MKKILLLASVIVCLTACSSPLNKSVTELLTPEEVNQVNKKYDFFCNMYDGIEKTMKYSTTAEKEDIQTSRKMQKRNGRKNSGIIVCMSG